MPTHQEISGMSDEAFVQRMITSYPERFAALQEGMCDIT